MPWPPVDAYCRHFRGKIEGDPRVTLKIIINYALLILIVPLKWVKVFHLSGKKNRKSGSKIPIFVKMPVEILLDPCRNGSFALFFLMESGF
jgi:hypothetical protein